MDTEKPLQRILYIEDDPLNVLVAQLHLGNRWQVVHAANSEVALDLLSKEHFALILMDIELADSQFDGIQLTEAIRGCAQQEGLSNSSLEANKDTPIIVVTAYYGLYSPEQLADRGATNMMTKPIDFKRLISLVEACGV